MTDFMAEQHAGIAEELPALLHLFVSGGSQTTLLNDEQSSVNVVGLLAPRGSYEIQPFNGNDIAGVVPAPTEIFGRVRPTVCRSIRRYGNRAPTEDMR